MPSSDARVSVVHVDERSLLETEPVVPTEEAGNWVTVTTDGLSAVSNGETVKVMVAADDTAEVVSNWVTVTTEGPELNGDGRSAEKTGEDVQEVESEPSVTVTTDGPEVNEDDGSAEETGEDVQDVEPESTVRVTVCNPLADTLKPVT